MNGWSIIALLAIIYYFAMCGYSYGIRSRFVDCPTDPKQNSCAGVVCSGVNCSINPCCTCVTTCNAPGSVPDGYDCTEFTAAPPACIPKNSNPDPYPGY